MYLYVVAIHSIHLKNIQSLDRLKHVFISDQIAFKKKIRRQSNAICWFDLSSCTNFVFLILYLTIYHATKTIYITFRLHSKDNCNNRKKISVDKWGITFKTSSTQYHVTMTQLVYSFPTICSFLYICYFFYVETKRNAALFPAPWKCS